MPPLYVIRQLAKLRISNRRLQVEFENENGEVEILYSAPLGQVSQVVLFGNIGLTTPAIDALLAQETDVIFLTEDGKYRGRLIGSTPPHVPLRRAQYAALNQPFFVLEMAAGFVRAKLSHQRALLQRHNRENPQPPITSAVESITQNLESIAHKLTVPALRGLEGASTAAYFSGFRCLFSPQWKFNDRNRRPPADPVNVLLSFGYTLLAEAAAGAVQAVGLDPYAGFLHEVAYNRPALALDLMEEFRPVVDGIILWACHSGQITPADFTPGPPERPVILGEAGRKKFLLAYEQRFEQSFTHPIRGQKLQLRQCLLEQAYQVSHRITDNDPGYTGMGFR